MPIIYFMEYGIQLQTKGESFKQKRSFWRRKIHTEGMNGHPVEINPKHVMAREAYPMAEYEKRQEEIRQKQEEEMRQNPNPGREGRIFRPGTGLIKKVN